MESWKNYFENGISENSNFGELFKDGNLFWKIELWYKKNEELNWKCGLHVHESGLEKWRKKWEREKKIKNWFGGEMSGGY